MIANTIAMPATVKAPASQNAAMPADAPVEEGAATPGAFAAALLAQALEAGKPASPGKSAPETGKALPPGDDAVPGGEPGPTSSETALLPAEIRSQLGAAQTSAPSPDALDRSDVAIVARPVTGSAVASPPTAAGEPPTAAPAPVLPGAAALPQPLVPPAVTPVVAPVLAPSKPSAQLPEIKPGPEQTPAPSAAAKPAGEAPLRASDLRLYVAPAPAFSQASPRKATADLAGETSPAKPVIKAESLLALGADAPAKVLTSTSNPSRHRAQRYASASAFSPANNHKYHRSCIV